MGIWSGLDEVMLAYAVTCHKAQGAEWPFVIVALDDAYGARMVTTREWLYTAISRAKRVCFLVGKRSSVDDMCHRVGLDRRKTFLTESIIGGSWYEQEGPFEPETSPPL